MYRVKAKSVSEKFVYWLKSFVILHRQAVIYNTSGQSVKTLNFTNESEIQIPISSFSKDIYFLRISTNNQTLTDSSDNKLTSLILSSTKKYSLINFHS